MFPRALLIALIAIALVALLVVIYTVVRAAYLVVRGGGFQLWLACPGCNKWMRGIAFYGQKKLAWYKLFSFKLRPNLVFERTQLDVIELRNPDITSGLVTVVVQEPAGDYKMALEPAHASAFASWVTSSPPGGDSELKERLAEYANKTEPTPKKHPISTDTDNNGRPEV